MVNRPLNTQQENHDDTDDRRGGDNRYKVHGPVNSSPLQRLVVQHICQEQRYRQLQGNNHDCIFEAVEKGIPEQLVMNQFHVILKSDKSRMARQTRPVQKRVLDTADDGISLKQDIKNK